MKLTAANKAKIKSKIGERILLFREAQGLTLLDVEVLTGIDSSKLAKIEKGLFDFHVTKLIVIAHALKVQLSAIYPIEEESK